MSEYRIRLDAETNELFEKLRDETGFQGQRKDARFVKALLNLLQDLLERDMLARELSASLMLRGSTGESATDKTGDPGSVTPETMLSTLGVSDQEYEEIAQACNRSYGSLDEFVRVAVLAEARKCNETAQKVAELDLANPLQRGRRRGAGYAYVEAVVQQLIEANLQAKTSEELSYITAGQIAKMTGTNRKDINAYFENHRDMLDQHHKSVGFATPEAGEAHNRMKGYAFRTKNYEKALKAEE